MVQIGGLKIRVDLLNEVEEEDEGRIYKECSDAGGGSEHSGDSTCGTEAGKGGTIVGVVAKKKKYS